MPTVSFVAKCYSPDIDGNMTITVKVPWSVVGPSQINGPSTSNSVYRPSPKAHMSTRRDNSVHGFYNERKKNKFRRAKIVLRARELSDPRRPKHRHYGVRIPHPQEGTRPLHVENSADKKLECGRPVRCKEGEMHARCGGK